MDDDDAFIAFVIGILILVIFALMLFLIKGEAKEIDRISSEREKCIMAYHGEWGTLNCGGKLWGIRNGKPYHLWVPKKCMNLPEKKYE